LDEHLRKLGIPQPVLKDMPVKVHSHLAIASTVATRGADIGIGNEKSGLQVNNIEFIPLQAERYELVIKKEDIEKAPFQAVLEILRSEEFKLEIEGLGGYDLAEIGKIIAET
jgi:putative molybdopterin biosynthesis protein